jgi:dihydropteroate synthase
LLERVEICEAHGIKRDKLIVDPGFGFGKRARHNLRLMKYLERIVHLDLPVLVGISRKSIIGELLKVPMEERLAGSLAMASLAVWKGAKLIRTHDVKETAQAVKLSNYVMQVKDFD